MRRDFQQVGLQLRAIRLRQVEPGAQRTVVRQKTFDLQVERGRICQVCNANGAAADPVFISRANAALGRADLSGAERAFTGRVDILVPGQDQGGIVCQNERLRRHLNPLRLNAFNLGQHVPRVDHDAIADHRQLTTAHES